MLHIDAEAKKERGGGQFLTLPVDLLHYSCGTHVLAESRTEEVKNKETVRRC